MHYPRQHFILMAGLFVLSLVGCSAPSDHRATLDGKKVVFVADTVAAPDLKFEGLNNTVHDTAVRELSRRGYTLATSPDEAHVLVRSTWRRRQADGLRYDRTDMQLSLSLFDQKGRRLFEADSGPAFAASFWNEPRTADEVVKLLRKLPSPRQPDQQVR